MPPGCSRRACARADLTCSSRACCTGCPSVPEYSAGVFTGIVEELGTIIAIEGDDAGLQLQIDAPALAPLSAVGDSINVSGCCLTVVAIHGTGLAFEAVPETLRRTALGGLGVGARVNLE